MDPNAPRKAPDPRDLERLQRVQRRVMSVLLVTTVLHLAAGFVIAADHVDPDRLDARIGLNVIATAFMVGGIAAALLINHRSWRSPWLLLGLLPGIVGLWWTVL
jgi:peptidoglycan/LPS O-acetylase OafA/YrhL